MAAGDQGAAMQPPWTSEYALSVSPYKSYRSAVHGAERAPRFDYGHRRVDDFVTRFQTDLRGFFARALSRSGRYVPRMSSILEKEGLPQELAYLPLIESGFRPHAVSRAGAVGPWQLIPGTGRRYGLRIDRYVDERRDPVKSTQAAARYLKDLYSEFGDWHLSLAAYNTGEGNISRILASGNAEDFWEMSHRGYLYQETEDFVPEFLAALQIAEAPAAYGFTPPLEEAPRYDTVRVNRPLSLATVARLSGTSVDTIRNLNPALRRGVVPPSGYTVRVPSGSKDAFATALEHLPRTLHRRAHARRFTYHSHHPRVARRARAQRGQRLRVCPGETVAAIARRHRVSVHALLRANHIRNPRALRAGRTLTLPSTARRSRAAVLATRHNERARVVD